MTEKKARIVFSISSILLVIVVLIFTEALNLSSFKKNYIDYLTESYKVVGSEPVGKIEYAIKYGKPLENFYGMKELLQDIQKNTPSLSNVEIISREGKVLYDLQGKKEFESLPWAIMENVKFQNKDSNGDKVDSSYTVYENQYHDFLPIYDNEGKWIGCLDMVFDNSIITSRTNGYLREAVKYSAALTLIASVLLILFFMKLSIFCEGALIKKKILIALISVLSCIQIIFGIVNFRIFTNIYTDVAREYIEKTGVTIGADLNYIVDMGVSYMDLPEVEKWLDKFVKSAPEIESISIKNAGGMTIYTTKGSVINDGEVVDSKYIYTKNLKKDSLGISPVLEIQLSVTNIQNKIKDICLDMGTVFVTSFFFLVEVSIFLLVVLGKKMNSNSETGQNEDVKIVRTLSFIFYFGSFLSLSFIPVLMKSFYKPIFGLSETLILGLPISAETFCGAFGALAAGFLMSKKGWKPIFGLGLSVFCIGALLSGASRGALTFIAARGVFGFGYGICIMSMQGFANSSKSAQEKSMGVSSFNSGGFAGINCGCVLGGMIAERIGYSSVFFVTLAIAILAGMFALFFMKNAKIEDKNDNKENTSNKKEVISFIANKNILSFFLFVVVPVAVSGMFLEYFMPIYSANNGISSANVGRLVLINGLVIVYFGPSMSKLLSKRLNIKRTLILAMGIIAVSFSVFYLMNNFAAAIMTAFLLGISTGFGEGAQNNYLLQLPATNKLGEGKALGIFSVATKIGQTAGPIVFGAFMSIGEVKGIGAITVVLLISIFMFLIFSGKNKKVTTTS